MVGRTNVGGGGSGNSFAVIVATYPEGSVCTCSDGNKTLKAKGTSGRYIFNVPNEGAFPQTWTVSCTDGTNTASQTVTMGNLLTGSEVPEVIFSAEQAAQGVFAATAETTSGGIYIYAADVPEPDTDGGNSITIPVIICWRS